MLYKRLGSTDIMASEIGFGASVFDHFFPDSGFNTDKESQERAKLLVKTAIDSGINYFDTAPWYGNSEFLLGPALQDYPRSSYYLATKIGRYNVGKPEIEWFDFSYKRTIESVENSLRLLKTDYLDLVQVHDFEFLGDDISILVNETLPALESLKKSGKIRYIGINTYIIERLKALIEISPIKIDSVLTFCHYTIMDDSLKNYTDYFRSKGLGIISAAPLASGLITPNSMPHWNHDSQSARDTVKKAFEYANSKGVDLTKLAIHFAVKTDKTDLTIVSMSSVEIIQKNIQACNELNDQEKQVMQEVREKIFIPFGYTGYGDVEVRDFMEKVKEQRELANKQS